MHVSKPPKETAPAALFFNSLKSASEKYPGSVVDGVHKKINLGDNQLAWEHERFSIRRLPAFTLSSLKSHKDTSRGSIVDVKDTFDLDLLVQNTKIVAEALSRQIYNLGSDNVFEKSLVSY